MNRRGRPNKNDSPPTAPARLTKATLLKGAKWLASVDPALEGVLEKHGPPPLLRRPATFATLVHIILEQQVSVESAKSTFDRLKATSEGTLTPEHVTELGPDRLRELGFSRQKARYAAALADDCTSGRFRIDQLSKQSDEEVQTTICARLGLGTWSAEVFMMMALLRPDVFPVGDLALVKGIKELDDFEYDGAEAIMERGESWRPYRSVATRMVWQHYAHQRKRDLF
ncbi:MAG: DNA-3-methyladenine glycosylase 2 family protein [Planctomycetota bacterium]